MEQAVLCSHCNIHPAESVDYRGQECLSKYLSCEWCFGLNDEIARKIRQNNHSNKKKIDPKSYYKFHSKPLDDGDTLEFWCNECGKTKTGDVAGFELFSILHTKCKKSDVFIYSIKKFLRKVAQYFTRPKS